VRTCVRYSPRVTSVDSRRGQDAPTLRWRLVDDDSAQPQLFEERGWIPGRDELAGIELLHVRAQSMVNRVPEGAVVPFRWTINPYRGCTHACVYCFARPTHEYLGLDVGRDFEKRIVVKVNAVERTAADLSTARWAREHVAMGTNTDPYQLVESRYRLTRGLIGVLAEHDTPFSILTKSPLILRDEDVLGAAAERVDVATALSIGTLDAEVARITEPQAPSPQKRLEAVARLNDSGLACGVLIAPVIPGLTDNDPSIERLVRAALDAGATSVSAVLLHLRPGVREHYLAWLQEQDAPLAEQIDNRYRSAYGPKQARRSLNERVRALVARHGGVRPTARRARSARFSRPRARPKAPAAEHQLRLDITAGRAGAVRPAP
jgi:DNA repair photolyase